LARRLFTVSDTFTLRGHGLVLVPGLHPVGEERFRVGDSILLKRPDGLEIRTTIGGLELPTPNPKHEVVIMLTELSKGDVPNRDRSVVGLNTRPPQSVGEAAENSISVNVVGEFEEAHVGD
jgi:hypothetical protein